MIKLGRHTIYDEYHQIPRKEYDLVITDPPWNATGIAFDKQGFDHDHLAEWITWNMKQNAWCMAFLPFSAAIEFAEHMRNKFIYVWKKPTGIYRTTVMRPVLAHDLIYAFIRPDLKKVTDLYMDKKKLRTKGKPYKDRPHSKKNTEYSEAMGIYPDGKTTTNTGYREGTSILEFSSMKGKPKERTGHPTQKPLALLKYLINAYCPPGGVVLDPTLGSGTTMMACELEGRTCVGAEKNPKYRAMIKKRYDETLGGWT